MNVCRALCGIICLNTVAKQYKRWSGISNGELLKRSLGLFDVLIISDQNLRYQQNLKGSEIAVLALPTNDIYEVMTLVAEIKQALSQIKPGDFLEIKRSNASSPWKIVKVTF